MNTDDPKFRDIVAEAVHQAVTTYTSNDGLGHCDLYSLAGVILLRHLTGEPYQLQLGSLKYLADPAGNGWMEFDARDGGLERLEYHAWIGKAGAKISTDQDSQSSLCEVGEFIDFSVRHFRSMVEKMPQIKDACRIGDYLMMVMNVHGDHVAWTRPDEPPLYLWTKGSPPSDYRYTPDMNCMLAYYDQLHKNPGIMPELRRLVVSRYRGLLKQEGRS